MQKKAKKKIAFGLAGAALGAVMINNTHSVQADVVPDDPDNAQESVTQGKRDYINGNVSTSQAKNSENSDTDKASDKQETNGTSGTSKTSDTNKNDETNSTSDTSNANKASETSKMRNTNSTNSTSSTVATGELQKDTNNAKTSDAKQANQTSDTKQKIKSAKKVTTNNTNNTKTATQKTQTKSAKKTSDTNHQKLASQTNAAQTAQTLKLNLNSLDKQKISPKELNDSKLSTNILSVDSLKDADVSANDLTESKAATSVGKLTDDSQEATYLNTAVQDLLNKGYAKTAAGYTKYHKQDKIAKKSNLWMTWDQNVNRNLTDNAQMNKTIDDGWGFGLRINTTIDKNDIKKGNRILIGSIAIDNPKDGRSLEFSQENTKNGSVYYNGEYIGYLEYENHQDELDYFLRVNTDKNYAKDVDLSYNVDHAYAINCWSRQYNLLRGTTTDNPFVNYFVTPNNDQNMAIKYTAVRGNRNLELREPDRPSPNKEISQFNTSMYWHDYTTNGMDTHGNPDFNLQKVIQVENVDPENYLVDRGSGLTFHLDYSGIFNKDGKQVNSTTWRPYEIGFSSQKLADGLTNTQVAEAAHEMREKTGIGYVRSYNPQTHKMLFGFDFNPYNVIKANVNVEQAKTKIANQIKRSAVYNIYDPDHGQDYIDGTIKHYEDLDWEPQALWLEGGIGQPLDNMKSYTQVITDVTPGQDTKKMSQGSLSPNGSAVKTAEYAPVLVHYLDDDENQKDIGQESVLGVENEPLVITAKAPDNYILNQDKTINYGLVQHSNNPDVYVHVKHKIIGTAGSLSDTASEEVQQAINDAENHIYGQSSKSYQDSRNAFLKHLKDMGLDTGDTVDPATLKQNLMIPHESSTKVTVTPLTNATTVTSTNNGTTVLRLNNKQDINGDFARATWTGFDDKATYRGQHIGKIVMTLSNLKYLDGPTMYDAQGTANGELHLYDDFIHGVWFNHSNGFDMDIQLYDDQGKLLDLGSDAYLAFGSLNSNGNGTNYQESAQLLSNGQAIAFPESTVSVHDGNILYADGNNSIAQDDPSSYYYHWDNDNNSTWIYGAGAFQTSGNHIKIRAGVKNGSAWLNYSTTIPQLSFDASRNKVNVNVVKDPTVTYYYTDDGTGNSSMQKAFDDAKKDYQKQVDTINQQVAQKEKDFSQYEQNREAYIQKLKDAGLYTDDTIDPLSIKQNLHIGTDSRADVKIDVLNSALGSVSANGLQFNYASNVPRGKYNGDVLRVTYSNVTDATYGDKQIKKIVVTASNPVINSNQSSPGYINFSNSVIEGVHYWGSSGYDLTYQFYDENGNLINFDNDAYFSVGSLNGRGQYTETTEKVKLLSGATYAPLPTSTIKVQADGGAWSLNPNWDSALGHGNDYGFYWDNNGDNRIVGSIAVRLKGDTLKLRTYEGSDTAENYGPNGLWFNWSTTIPKMAYDEQMLNMTVHYHDVQVQKATTRHYRVIEDRPDKYGGTKVAIDQHLTAHAPAARDLVTNQTIEAPYDAGLTDIVNDYGNFAGGTGANATGDRTITSGENIDIIPGYSYTMDTYTSPETFTTLSGTKGGAILSVSASNNKFYYDFLVGANQNDKGITFTYLPDSRDFHIRYTPLPQTAHVNFVNKRNNKLVKQDTLNGVTDQTISVKETVPTEDGRYYLDPDSKLPTSYTFNADKNQNITVYLDENPTNWNIKYYDKTDGKTINTNEHVYDYIGETTNIVKELINDNMPENYVLDDSDLNSAYTFNKNNNDLIVTVSHKIGTIDSPNASYKIGQDQLFNTQVRKIHFDAPQSVLMQLNSLNLNQNNDLLQTAMFKRSAKVDLVTKKVLGFTDWVPANGSKATFSKISLPNIKGYKLTVTPTKSSDPNIATSLVAKYTKVNVGDLIDGLSDTNNASSATPNTQDTNSNTSTPAASNTQDADKTQTPNAVPATQIPVAQDDNVSVSSTAQDANAAQETAKETNTAQGTESANNAPKTVPAPPLAPAPEVYKPSKQDVLDSKAVTSDTDSTSDTDDADDDLDSSTTYADTDISDTDSDYDTADETRDDMGDSDDDDDDDDDDDSEDYDDTDDAEDYDDDSDDSDSNDEDSDDSDADDSYSRPSNTYTDTDIGTTDDSDSDTDSDDEDTDDTDDSNSNTDDTSDSDDTDDDSNSSTDDTSDSDDTDSNTDNTSDSDSTNDSQGGVHGDYIPSDVNSTNSASDTNNTNSSNSTNNANSNTGNTNGTSSNKNAKTIPDTNSANGADSTKGAKKAHKSNKARASRGANKANNSDSANSAGNSNNAGSANDANASDNSGADNSANGTGAPNDSRGNQSSTQGNNKARRGRLPQTDGENSYSLLLLGLASAALGLYADRRRKHD